MLNFLRSALVFVWLVIALIPLASTLLLVSLVSSTSFIYWHIAVPYLKSVIEAARLIAGVRYRVQGSSVLEALSESGRRVILCPKHQ